MPSPKALALTILVDWSNESKDDSSTNPRRSLKPCWLCIHFGPPPSALPWQRSHASLAGQWQYTMNIYASDKIPLVKKKNETPIPKERRALLWFNTQPFDSYRYANVMPHIRFPPPLTPRVIAFHADRAEPDLNATVWVKKKTLNGKHKEDSHIKVVRGHIYHFHITFADGSLVNQCIAEGWGFTASLFTYKRKRGHLIVSPSRAVTQIRANWLDVVEADPDHEELEEANIAKFIYKRDEEELRAAEITQRRLAERTASASTKQQPSTGPVLSNSVQTPSLQGTSPFPPGYGSSHAPGPVMGGPHFGPLFPTFEVSSFQHPAGPVNSSTMRSISKKAEEWTQSDLDQCLTWINKPETVHLPEISKTKYEPSAAIDFGFEVDAFFDAPSAPAATPVSATIGMTTPLGFHPSALQQTPTTQEKPQLTTSDRELLSLFRALEQRAQIIATDSNSMCRESAVRLTQVLSASGQLGGWKHVEEFMTDQERYARKARVMEKMFARPLHASVAGSQPPSTAPSSPLETISPAPEKEETPRYKMDELSESATSILKHAMMRASWVLEIEKKNAGKLSDGKTLERVLAVLQKDQQWMNDSAMFLKSAEQQVVNVININPAVFAKFRELQSRGVQWPHSPHLRRHIERTGFTFRPMMIKRDRCVCDTCGVEASGWRPWHNPWLFHDWSKRHPFAPPPGTFG